MSVLKSTTKIKNNELRVRVRVIRARASSLECQLRHTPSTCSMSLLQQSTMEATTREIVEEILHPQNPGYSEEHQLDRLVISVPEIEVTLPQHVSLQDEEEIK